MARLLAIALLVFFSVSCRGTSAVATRADGGPKIGFFSKLKGNHAFKKKKREPKYHRAAAKKQRKAKWQRHSMVPSNR